MSQPQFQNNHYYTINTKFDVNGNLIGASASAIEEIISDHLKLGKGSIFTESLKFLIKENLTSSVITKSVEVGFNDEEVTVNGVVVDFIGENIVQNLLSSIAISVLGVGSPGLLPIIAIAAGSSGIIWSNIKNSTLDLFQGSIVDLKFIDSSGVHNSGIILSSGVHNSGIILPSEAFDVLGKRGSITAYLANNSQNVDGGYLTFTDARDGDQINGEIYKISGISAFENAASNLNISLSEFLNVGIGGKTNNDIFYSNFNKIVFTENTINPSQSSKIYIPIATETSPQIISVDAIYNGSENGTNFLAGRTNQIILGTTQITYPDAIILNTSEYGASAIIKSNRSEGNLEGSHILIGSNSSDQISFDGYATTIDGKQGFDTIDYSSLNLGSRDINVDLKSGNASNGFALQHFT